MKYNLIYCIILFLSMNVYAQLPNEIKHEVEKLYFDYSNKNVISNEKLVSIDRLLNSFDEKTLEKEFLTNLKSFNSLKEAFNTFLIKHKEISPDSSIFLLNQWNLKFSNTFYDYFKNEFFNSKHDKIIFFTASVSCHCTLEMCSNQLISLIDLVQIQKNNYDYLIVDIYENNELQEQFKTYFAPSFAILDENNLVINRIENDKDAGNKLLLYLQ